MGSINFSTICNASAKSYGACCFLRSVLGDGSIHVSLLVAKGRLAPIKTMTIPRLELQAAVTATVLDCMVRKNFAQHSLDSMFWSDSLIVLAYIKSETKRFHVFTSNRVSKIRQVSDPHQWNHIPGKLNPADILSRGCTANELPDAWFNGPAFLWDFKESWPVAQPLNFDIPDSDLEVKPSSTVSFNTTSSNDGEANPHGLSLMLLHYSSFYRFKKALSWLS